MKSGRVSASTLENASPRSRGHVEDVSLLVPLSRLLVLGTLTVIGVIRSILLTRNTVVSHSIQHIEKLNVVCILRIGAAFSTALGRWPVLPYVG